MDKLNQIQPAMIRIDSSRFSAHLYKGPELSFMQKLGRGVGKAVSFLGPVGAGILAVAAPPLLPAALAIYGGSKLTSKATDAALAKDASEVKEYKSEMAKQTFGLPGFFDSTQSPAQVSTDFIAPSEFGPSIERTTQANLDSVYHSMQRVE